MVWLAQFSGGLQVMFQGNSASVWLQAPRKDSDYWQGPSASCAALGPSSASHKAGCHGTRHFKALIPVDRNLHNSYQLPFCQPLDSSGESENLQILVFGWLIFCNWPQWSWQELCISENWDLQQQHPMACRVNGKMSAGTLQVRSYTVAEMKYLYGMEILWFPRGFCCFFP